MPSRLVVLAVIAVIAVGSAIAGATIATTFSARPTITTTQIVTSTSQILIYSTPTNVSSTPIPTIGLSLQLTLNATVLLPNSSVGITWTDFNTLPVNNTLGYSNNWALPALFGFCGSSSGYAIFQGYYVSSNITDAVPLPMSPPDFEVPCPDLNFSSIMFHPESDIATVSGGIFGGGSVVPQEQSTAVSGYFTHTLVHLSNGWTDTMLNFNPGWYTVAAGDEWGDLAFTHFQVM